MNLIIKNLESSFVTNGWKDFKFSNISKEVGFDKFPNITIYVHIQHLTQNNEPQLKLGSLQESVCFHWIF